VTTDEPAPPGGPLADLELLGVSEAEIADGLRHLELYTMRGLLSLFWHGPPGAPRVVLTGGGAIGGVLGPRGLYHHLGVALAAHDIATVRVNYRKPNDLQRCVLDVGSAAQIAYNEGGREFVLLGHSFGGAVVLNVAHALGDMARGVVTLATQSAGCEVAGELRADLPLLFIHGDRDEMLPSVCSEVVRMMAGHGDLVILPGAGHGLVEAADEIAARLLQWIPEVFS